MLQRDWGWGLPADQAGFLERAGSEVDRSRRSGVVCNTLRSTGVGLTLSEGGLLCAGVVYIVLVGPAGAIWGGGGARDRAGLCRDGRRRPVLPRHLAIPVPGAGPALVVSSPRSGWGKSKDEGGARGETNTYMLTSYFLLWLWPPQAGQHIRKVKGVSPDLGSGGWCS